MKREHAQLSYLTFKKNKKALSLQSQDKRVENLS